jgi:type III pantothenate kinase
MRNTAIPQYAVPGDFSLFTRNTASGIESAAVMATCCLIKSTVTHLQSRVSTGVSCILTGGAAEQLIPALEVEVQHEPNLVLNGLALVAANSTDS